MKKIAVLLKLIGILIFITADLFFSSNSHNVHTNQVVLDFVQPIVIIVIYAGLICFLSQSMKKWQIGSVYHIDDNIKKNFDFKEEYNSYTSKSYTEWKNNFPINKNIQINEEFRKFLIRKGKQFKNSYDCTVAVTVPFIISFLFSMKDADGIDGAFKILAMVAGLVVIIITITKELYSLDNHVSFFEDCVEVCDEYIKSQNNNNSLTGEGKTDVSENNLIVKQENRKTTVTVIME